MFRFLFAIVPLLVSPAFSGDLDIPDERVCCESSAPRDVKIPGHTHGNPLTTITTNRTLIIQAGGDTDCARQAIRVTFKDLARRYDPWNGVQLWVGAPYIAGEAPNSTIPRTGFASYYWAELQCTPECRDDWDTFGDLNVYHEGIVPDSEYEIQLVACDEPTCADDESNFSAPLTLRTSIFGDTVSNCATSPCGPPEGRPMQLIDKLAVVWAFIGSPYAPRKARVDFEPRELDHLINITDVLFALRAYLGLQYELQPSTPEPCP